MLINTIRSNLPDYAKDIKINLDKIVSEEYSIYLSKSQIFSIFISCIYSTRNETLIDIIRDDEILKYLSSEAVNAAKSAAVIMAMNNVYYRFIHLIEDQSYEKMAVNLRMQSINRPGINKEDFELCCLAISALNGCGMCMNSHVEHLSRSSVSKQSIQSTIRIASVVNAIAQSYSMGVLQ